MFSFGSRFRAAHRGMARRRLSRRSAARIVRAVYEHSDSLAKLSSIVQLPITKALDACYLNKRRPIPLHVVDWKQRVSMLIARGCTFPCGNCGAEPTFATERRTLRFRFVVWTKRLNWRAGGMAGVFAFLR